MTSVTDGDGEEVAIYEYDSFGNVLTEAGSLANEFKFSTKQADKRGQLIDFGFRWYDPEIGRFTQRDPIGAAGGLNLYEYCDANPANFIDPLGLDYAMYDIVDDPWHGEPPATLGEGHGPGRDGRKAGEPGWNPLGDFWGDVTSAAGWVADNAVEMADMLGRLANEPYDWFRTGLDWASGDFQWTDLVGLLPILTPAMMRAADDPADALRATRAQQRAVRQLADDAADASRRTGRGLPLEDARTLDTWRQEYGVYGHGPVPGHGRRAGYWSNKPHMKVSGASKRTGGHIPVEGM